MQGEIRILFAGGGTGGHVFPAIRIALHLKEKWGARCRFIGTRKGLEQTKVPQAGFVLKNIWISGFHRGLDFRNLLFPIKMMISLKQSRKEIREFQPDLVVGTGGYVSGPVLYQAGKMGIPTAIQEQNSFPGITTRLLAGRVDLVMLAYEEALKHLKNVRRFIIVGNPVPAVTKHPERRDSFQFFGLDPTRPVILVFGGSQGSRNINEAVDTLISDDLLEKTQILWQTGPMHFEKFREKYSRNHFRGLRIYPFIDRMDLAYATADLAICRSGAMTLAELSAAGVPAILIPLPTAAGNHQLKNARAVESAGAARVVEDSQDTSRKLFLEIRALLDAPDERKSMSQKIKELHHSDSLEKISRELSRLIKGDAFRRQNEGI